MAASLTEIMSKIQDAFVPELAAGTSAVVHFKFTGTEATEWNAVIRDGKCEVAPGLPRTRPTITLRIDSEDFKRLVSGELDGTQALMQAKMHLDGDIALAKVLAGLFKRG
jgi:putative sterol carrier protein